LPEQFPFARPGEFVIMPNHFHGLVWILSPNECEEGTINRPLPDIVRSFKARTTIAIHRTVDPEFEWQRNFADHVIRDEEDLYHHRKYIEENPLKWELDKENPERRNDIL
jgi:REP element-mobilizing transposase RayT